MNQSELPSTAFIDPRGGNRAEINDLIQRVISLLLPYLSEAVQRPPLPPASLRDAVIAETPVAVEDLLEELRPLIAGAMNSANPGYLTDNSAGANGGQQRHHRSGGHEEI